MKIFRKVTITIISLFITLFSWSVRASETNIIKSDAVSIALTPTNSIRNFNQHIQLVSDIKPDQNNRFFRLVDVFMPVIDSEVVIYKNDFKNFQYEGGSLGSITYIYLMREPRTRDTLSYSWRVGRYTLVQTSVDFIGPSINGVYQVCACVRTSPSKW